MPEQKWLHDAAEKGADNQYVTMLNQNNLLPYKCLKGSTLPSKLKCRKRRGWIPTLQQDNKWSTSQGSNCFPEGHTGSKDDALI